MGNDSSLRFGIKLLIAFALSMAAFEWSRGSEFERFLVEDLILAPTTALIDWLTPHEQVRLIGRTLSSPLAHLHVTRGCEGVEMFLMLAAGIFAFPVSARRRISGLLYGSILAYGLSVARLMALYYVLAHARNLWESLHGLVLPLGPLVVMMLFFLHWSRDPGAGGRAVAVPTTGIR